MSDVALPAPLDEPGDGQEPETSSSNAMRVHLDGFEGPLDLLLSLARRQEVDLTKISVLALADQYIAAIAQLGLDATRLERATEWLVIAAWLTWLKSRLLLPKGSREADDAERSADVLVGRLAQVERIRALAAWLEARPQLGRDTYARGAPETTGRTLTSDLSSLLRICLTGLRPRQLPPSSFALHISPISWRVTDAIGRLQALLGKVPYGTELIRFLPPYLSATSTPVGEGTCSNVDLPLQRRGAIATTLVGALELARAASIHLQQDNPFGPILVHPPSDRSEPSS